MPSTTLRPDAIENAGLEQELTRALTGLEEPPLPAVKSRSGSVALDRPLSVKLEIDYPSDVAWGGLLPDTSSLKQQVEAALVETELGQRFHRVLASLGISHLTVLFSHDSFSKGGYQGVFGVNWLLGEVTLSAAMEDGDILSQLIRQIRRHHSSYISHHGLLDYPLRWYGLSNALFQQGIFVNAHEIVSLGEPVEIPFDAVARLVARHLRVPLSPSGTVHIVLPEGTLGAELPPPSTLWDALGPLAPAFASGAGSGGWQGEVGPRAFSYRAGWTWTPLEPGGRATGINLISWRSQTIRALQASLDTYYLDVQVSRGTGRDPPVVLRARFFPRDVFPREVASIVERLTEAEQGGQLTPSDLQHAAQEIFSRMTAFAEFVNQFLYEAAQQGVLDRLPKKEARLTVLRNLLGLMRAVDKVPTAPPPVSPPPILPPTGPEAGLEEAATAGRARRERLDVGA